MKSLVAGVLPVLLMPLLAGCIWATPIEASVDDYAVSPDGSQVAIAVYSGREYHGQVEIRILDDGAWRPVPIPFEAYTATLRFRSNDTLDVLVTSRYLRQPTESALFRVTLGDLAVEGVATWTGDVVDVVEWQGKRIIAMAPTGTNRYDLYWGNGTAITDFRFWSLRDLEVVGDTLYFSKASFINREGPHDPFRPEDNPGSQPRVMALHLQTNRVDFVFSAKEATEAGVTTTLQHICADGPTLHMVDSSAEVAGSALYAYEPMGGGLRKVVDLPPNSVAACHRGPHVYFIKEMASRTTPEELWRMELQRGTEERFAP